MPKSLTPFTSPLNQASVMLGGLSPDEFMRTYWQKKPLLVRQALPGVQAPASLAQLKKLAQSEDVESRLVQQKGDDWTLRHGPLKSKDFPKSDTPQWTVLVQGLDLHLDSARALLDQFHFIPAARLDDLMISYASDGGGVGAHIDAYDVFLIQVHGQRRWRIGPAQDTRFIENKPLRLLQHFEPNQEWVLEPGDMLYLPPQYAHEGVAIGNDCMTCSVGFRSPRAHGLVSEVLQNMLDADLLGEPTGSTDNSPVYSDPDQAASPNSGRMPAALQDFVAQHIQAWLDGQNGWRCSLGETLTEPKPQVWFESQKLPPVWPSSVALNRKSRMLYDETHIYLNGESFAGAGRDFELLQQLADTRQMSEEALKQLSAQALEITEQWVCDGWLEIVNSSV